MSIVPTKPKEKQVGNKYLKKTKPTTPRPAKPTQKWYNKQEAQRMKLKKLNLTNII